MNTIVMVAANDGINHETGYGREHEQKKASERHYIPLSLSYEIPGDHRRLIEYV
jgi:hypothetical protein